MRHGSLFSGIDGFSLAAEWMNWINIFQVEIDNYCNKLLKQNFPNVKKYTDIRNFDGTEYRGLIDILTGGFPCQGFSVAGKQRGKSDPRWLWPQMFRVIREIQPPWIVGENVPGIIKLALEDICASLEGEGYEVQPFIIPSASIGAWDKRERVWIIGYNKNVRWDKYSGGCRRCGLSESMEMEESQRVCGTNDKNKREASESFNAQSPCKSTNRGGSGPYQSKQTGQPEGKFKNSGTLDQFTQQGEAIGSSQTKREEQMVCSNIHKQCQDSFGMLPNEERSITSKDNSGNKCGIMQSNPVNSNIKSTISEQSGETRDGGNGLSDGISDLNIKSLERHSGNEFSAREKEKTRRTSQANWLRDWIEVASELCRSNARVSSELDETLKIYGYKNSNYQETISKIDLFRGEILRDMWCEKHKIKQTSFKARPQCCNDIMHTMPYQYTYERRKLGQRIEKDKILCDLWNGILSTSFEKTQDLQSQMFERIREIERNEKAGHDRTNRIKALGNSVNPYVVYEIFKAIEQF